MPRLLAALSPLNLLNALSGDRRVIERRGLSYGPGSRDTADLYRPRDRKTPAPVIVFFYGGGWEEGDRGSYRFVGTALAALGYVVIIPDYRVYPEVRFPAFVEDGARAVRWAAGTVAEHGGDPRRLVLAGHSAGAHIAALLALDGHFLGDVGLDNRAISGWIGLSGPYDFLPLHSARLKLIFPEAVRPQSQPIVFAAPGQSPALLITGSGDRVVDPGNTTRLAERLCAAGNVVESHLYPRASHAAVLGALARPLHFLGPTLGHVSAFLARITSTTTTKEIA